MNGINRNRSRSLHGCFKRSASQNFSAAHRDKQNIVGLQRDVWSFGLQHFLDLDLGSHIPYELLRMMRAPLSLAV